MDHPTSLQRDPWRITAIAAAGLAAFELVLLIMLAMAFFARPLIGGGDEGAPRAAVTEKPAAKSEPAAKASSRPAAKSPAEPKLARNETSVIVLNGNGSAGAAAEKADLVQTRGYIITATDNAPHTGFDQSLVMFRPGYELEAKRLAKDFGIARVTPLDGLVPADLQGAHVALIVGAS